MSLYPIDEFFLKHSEHSVAEANKYLKELLDKYYKLGFSKGYIKACEDHENASKSEDN